MPKKLYVSSNERVDLLDFTRASSDYTQETSNFDRAKLLQARRAAVPSGFRIELSDQGSNPGELTLYNGVGLDRAGNVLNNEDQINDSRTLTLAGANTTFYLEIEFVESNSDVDSRGFWDPTFSGNTPPGREFNLNVSTRLSPDWQVVSPVATTDFDVATNANSNRVPVAVLSTNASNEITGVTLVNAASNLELDAAAAATTFRVLDSTILPDTGSLIVGFGTANQETVNLTANDRANGVLTIAPGLTNPHQAGVIVRETGVTAAFVIESEVADPPTGSSGDPDRRRVLFRGDEIRGSAISKSKEVAAQRDDNDIRSLKDYVDFLAAQIRELKWGDLRSDSNAGAVPPLAFTDTRYFDRAGSIQGAKENLITIGDGAYSYGDLNSTSNDLGTILQQAHDALDATKGGTVYVKGGDYVFNASVTANRPLKVEFDAGVNFVAGSYASTAFFVTNTDVLEVVGMPPTPSFETLDIADFTGVDAKIILRDCTLGQLFVGLSTAGTKVLAENCTFYDDGSDALSNSVTRKTEVSVYRNCRFIYIDQAADSTRQLLLNGSDCTFEDCVFDISSNSAFSTARFLNMNLTSVTMGRLTFDRCEFLSTNTGKAVNPFDFRTSTGFPGMNGITFRDCRFDFTFGTTTTVQERTVLDFAQPGAGGAVTPMSNILIENCDFSALDQSNTIAGATEANPYRAVSIISQEPVYKVVVNNCKFGKEVDPAGATSTLPNHSTEFVYVEVSSPEGDGVTISNNSFSTFSRAIHVNGLGSFKVLNNYFRQKAQTAPFGTEIFAIYVNALNGEQALISGNHIDMLTFESADNVRGIFVNDATEISIVDNDVLVQDFFLGAGSNNVRGIYADTSNDPTILIVSNNHVEVVSGEKQAAAIYLDVVGGNNSSVNISDNFVEAKSLSGSLNGALRGILLAHDSSTSAPSPAVISNNLVRFDDSGSTVTSAVRGIEFTGDKIVVSGNSIHMDDVGSTDVAGIWASSSEYNTIDGNHISIQDTNAALYGIRGIYIEFDCSYTTISGNTIYGEEDMRWCIELTGPSNASEMRAVSVCNNTMDAACIDTVTAHGGIRMHTTNTTVGSTGAWSICGNTFHERRSNAGDADRYAIRVEGTLQVTGISIVGNTNSDDFTATNRPQDIFVDTVTAPNIQGNVCDRRASSAGSARIGVFNSQEILVEGNICPNSSAIGSATIIMQNCTAGLYDNNIGVGAAVPSTAGSTNVISGGSNHFTVGVLT